MNGLFRKKIQGGVEDMEFSGVLKILNVETPGAKEKNLRRDQEKIMRNFDALICPEFLGVK